MEPFSLVTMLNGCRGQPMSIVNQRKAIGNVCSVAAK